MSKVLLLQVSLLVSFFAITQNSGDYIPQKPAYPRLLNDENAYAYYHKDWRRLEDKLINHQKRTGNQLVLIMIPTLNGNNIDEMAVQVFRSWGIGEKETNTGLLVLVARKEQQIKIETGYGIEGQVTDLASGAILRNILEPGLSKYNFQLPPARKDKGYLPVLENVIDTLIRLTGEVNKKAIHHSTIHKRKIANKKKTSLIIYLLSIIIFFVLAKAGWRWLNTKLSSKNIIDKPKKKNQSLASMYTIPTILFFSIVFVTMAVKLHWWWVVGIGSFLFCRWVYYLPTLKRRREDIESEQQYYIQQKMYKQEYEARKKLLGSINNYPNNEAYWAKYKELGIPQLEKELMLGNYTPKQKPKKKKYGVGNLLYDYFLGTDAVEKKRGFSSIQSQGYTGESTAGQGADDYGGGGSGGGGASS
jgi:uncharacterized protein